ncbi:MAG: MarR family transcriptional regulator [Alphaproteobacteria bacterium]|nr:MAG: MarR family transcriptional regulator [Alphaproteobacteria bacterium]HYS87087.1 MarR family transcriptional regulator [Bradyrhizobium sp.]
MRQAARRKSDVSQSGEPVTGSIGAGNGGRRIDYGPLRDSIGYALRRAQVAVFQNFYEAFAELDIRPAQYSVLTIIELNPGVSQTQAADALAIKKTNFVAMIDGLEARGLARRTPSENDRRFHALRLTDKGKALMSKLHKIAAAHEGSITQRLGAAERRQLCEALRSIAELTAE